MRVYEGTLAATGLRFGVVVSRFNELVTARLLSGALDALKRMGADEQAIAVAWVPGAVEIPLVAEKMAASGGFDTVIALGAVVRGETSHYDHVCSMVASGVAQAGQRTGVPVIFGVVTTDTMEQALDRAGGKAGNKGAEAAAAATEMVTLLKGLAARPGLAPSKVKRA
ncbi:MAG: 6,7-dimethyl-8-ribityllumazine synthase [Trueperaceae bacterium]|jgi:6,7-dimethyl-8-ribityllumazine synthase|nr:6,7-dimethyl-8-ribityllumazine synthase [Truepera sp.]HRN17692.1 6,7-dimethyl-8-ribityllumazine synthase [Trueperaceae bacterium]HRQ10787.1 6,7-dimethyl-8-ribityllumazine synthase [Trueperaceae bacterium]